MSGEGSESSGETTLCPRGHVVHIADLTTRNGLWVCPVCDRADDVWRRPDGEDADGDPDGDELRSAGSGGASPELARPVAVAAEASPDSPEPLVEPAPVATQEVPAPVAASVGAPPAAPAAAPVTVPEPSPPAVIHPLRSPILLIGISVLVTLISSCFFVVEAVQLSDAGDVGGSARVVGTILAATGNLVLAVGVIWIAALLGRGPRP